MGEEVEVHYAAQTKKQLQCSSGREKVYVISAHVQALGGGGIDPRPVCKRVLTRIRGCESFSSPAAIAG